MKKITVFVLLIVMCFAVILCAGALGGCDNHDEETDKTKLGNSYTPQEPYDGGMPIIENPDITDFVGNNDSFKNESQSSVDINEAFADDCVIVVLDHKISGINKIHDVKFFTGVEIESITDLTRREMNMNDERGDFQQILQLHLKEKSKENVLKAVECLKKLEGVLIAEPNYIFSIDDVIVPIPISFE